MLLKLEILILNFQQERLVVRLLHLKNPLLLLQPPLPLNMPLNGVKVNRFKVSTINPSATHSPLIGIPIILKVFTLTL